MQQGVDRNEYINYQYPIILLLFLLSDVSQYVAN